MMELSNSEQWISAQIARCVQEKDRSIQAREKHLWNQAISAYRHMSHCNNRHSARQAWQGVLDSRPVCTMDIEKGQELPQEVTQGE